MSFNFRTISSLFLIALVFTLSSGLTIYTRICEDGCESVITLSDDNLHCKKQVEIKSEDSCKKNKEAEKSCCSKEENKDLAKTETEKKEKDKGCCSTEKFNLDFDFFGNFTKIELNPEFLSVVFNAPDSFTITNSALAKYFYTDLPPPNELESGRTIILKKNSFLI